MVNWRARKRIVLIKDIAKHGCAGGVSGLTYYNETNAFYDAHETEIWSILSDAADAAGILNGLMLYNICKNPDSLTILKNDLVWFAVEVAAQELQDNLEEPAAGAAAWPSSSFGCVFSSCSPVLH